MGNKIDDNDAVTNDEYSRCSINLIYHFSIEIILILVDRRHQDDNVGDADNSSDFYSGNVDVRDNKRKSCKTVEMKKE